MVAIPWLQWLPGFRLRVSQNGYQITALINDYPACGSRKGGDVIPLKALYNAEIPMVGVVALPCEAGVS